MKYFKYIILLFFFGLIIFYSYNQSIQFDKYSNSMLKNNIEFEGKIVYLIKSDNHAFGIIGIKIAKSNIHFFSKKTDKELFPYQINGNYAEIYTTINIDRKIGDYVKVVSNKSTIYYNPLKSNEIGDLHLAYEISFITENSRLKN